MSTKSDKYLGRIVEENGTDRIGRVANAWDEPEGVVGLYIETTRPSSFSTVFHSDSEHWTIVPDRRSVSEWIGYYLDREHA